MALTDESSGGIPATMLVSPTGYAGGNNGGFGWGGDWAWILLLLLIGGGNWGFGGGFGGGMMWPMMMGAGMGGYGIDYLYPWLNNSEHISGGFRDQQIQSSITGLQNSITSGFGDVATQLCGGFAGVNATVNSGVNALAQQINANQMASLERSFAAQTANTAAQSALQSQLAQCCCDNRAGLADVKYTIATENCADRAAISDGIRDILAATQAQTQTILNQLCSDKIEQKNDTIAQLRSELLYARGQASQDVQTAAIQAGQRALANEVEQYVAPRAVPAYYVQNPNCCGYNTGCGCNG